jgi:hypothetical protein
MFPWNPLGLVRQVLGIVAEDGNAIVYEMNGGIGEAPSGMYTEYVSKRTPGVGWSVESTTPRTYGDATPSVGAPTAIVPSSDFKRFLFTSNKTFISEEAENDHADRANFSEVNVFVSENIHSEPEWLGRPQFSEALPHQGDVPYNSYAISGASPSLDTVYFAYGGTLIPEDAPREPHVRAAYEAEGITKIKQEGLGPWGIYEWHDGHLVSAGRLPDGSISPWGAVPAGIAPRPLDNRDLEEPEELHNQVTPDGADVYFVSPDPCASEVSRPGPCGTTLPVLTKEASQMYLREPGPGGEKVSVLVSHSELPGHEGEPAPDGVVNAETGIEREITDIFGAPDGSRAYFISKDRLTVDAPSNEEPKFYEYEVSTGTVRYVSLSGWIVELSHDGSEALLWTGPSRSLELWRDGSGGGTLTPIAELGPHRADEAHFSADGSVVTFRTGAPIAGGFNNGGDYLQVYRYDIAQGSIDCLSCPPKGVIPSGSIDMSYNVKQTVGGFAHGFGGLAATPFETTPLSADGDRVFFDTPDPLLPQDVNGQRDVYEWENGKLYLISAGKSTDESIYLGSDKLGENVFFATEEGMVPGDTDQAYDVYDARIPRPGDNPPPSAVPCKGSTCQGPPSEPQLLTAPASETFNGAGNGVAPAPVHVVPKSLTRRQKLGRALKACKRVKSARKRARCQKRARKRYGAKAAGVNSAHHTGRGK